MNIVSIARDRLGKRLADDRYLGVAQASVDVKYLPELRRTARNDCGQAVREADESYDRRDVSIDLNDLAVDLSTSRTFAADIRMDFESLLPRLSDDEQMAVVLFDAGSGTKDVAKEMGLSPYKAEVVLQSRACEATALDVPARPTGPLTQTLAARKAAQVLGMYTS